MSSVIYLSMERSYDVDGREIKAGIAPYNNL